MNQIYTTKKYFINKVKATGLPVVLYGASVTRVKPYIRLLEKNNIEILCFTDSNPLLDGFHFMGYHISSVDKLRKMDRKFCIVIVAGSVHYEVIRQTLKKGKIKNPVIACEITTNPIKLKITNGLFRLVGGNEAPLNRIVINIKKHRNSGIGHYIFHQQKGAEAAISSRFFELGCFDGSTYSINDFRYAFSVVKEKMKILLEKNFSIYECVLPPGTRCSLKCRHCNQLFSHFMESGGGGL